MKFYVNETFDDFSIEENFIQSMHTESLSECAMFCTMKENCYSFSYKEDTTECKGYNVTKRYSLPGSATVSQGWRHYSAKEEGRSPHLSIESHFVGVHGPYGLHRKD